MSTALLHSPAQIMAQVLLDLGVGVTPDGTPWSVYIDKEPNAPDNCITVYDTTPSNDGRLQSGELMERYGFQVRVRATGHQVGYVKAKAIQTALNESVYDHQLTIDATQYVVHCVTGTNLLRLGMDRPSSERRLFTVNGMAVILARPYT